MTDAIAIPAAESGPNENRSAQDKNSRVAGEQALKDASAIPYGAPRPDAMIQDEALPSQPHTPEQATDTLESAQRARNQAAIRLLRAWLCDASGYDEHAWPIVKKALKENRLSPRTLFHE